MVLGAGCWFALLLLALVGRAGQRLAVSKGGREGGLLTCLDFYKKELFSSCLHAGLLMRV